MEPEDYLTRYPDPVVIGGVGGSGTRLIAQCLKEAGFHIGTDINRANDNLWFNLLFKRPDVLFSSEEAFDELLRIFIIGMRGGRDFSADQVALVEEVASRAQEPELASWLKQRAISLLSKKAERSPGENWGWKEPNSHIVLDRLVDRLEKIKYIHVARNGLDVAHSSNQNQLMFWGAYFLNGEFVASPYYSLKFWCITHKRVLHIGGFLESDFLFLNYDDFCLNPEKGIRELFGFLGLECDSLLSRLVALVNPPASIGRFKRHGTGIFAKEDVAFVESLGFDVSNG